MTRIAAILTCLSLAACGTAPARESQVASLGVEVTLAPGAAVSVKDTGLLVRFVAVTEDSRCPRDVTCVWAGQLKVQLEIQQSSQAASQVEILAGGTMEAGKYSVTVVRVEPQAVSTVKIGPQDYRATLRID
jgi:hypothetical protein